MKTREVIEYLDNQFLPELQENYDNSGFLVGNKDSDYTGTLVTLDVTPAAVDEAIDKGLSLIVSHHPLIFNGLKRITCGNDTGRMITRLIQHNISVYAAHTNLDNLDWGVNGILAEKLGLTDCHILKPSTLNCQLSTETGAGMVGKLPHPMPIMDFMEMVKQRLNLPILRTSQFTIVNSQLSIKVVAICGGSGSFLIGDAKKSGADIFLTGDLKYHDFQQAIPSFAHSTFILADIGHYESEQFAKELIYRVIYEKFSNFACQISEYSESYIQYI